MNWLNKLQARIRALAQRRKLKAEVDDEIHSHLEQRTQQNIETGMSPENAAREARRRFGNVQSVREECRDVRGVSFGEATLRDIRFGLRMLRKHAGIVGVACLCGARRQAVLKLSLGGELC